MNHTTEKAMPIYELSLNVRVTWQAHSLSNAGSNGSNRVFPRRQLLADGTETDATSGNIAKHHHAAVLAEYLEANGGQLCPACAARDARRAAALADDPVATGSMATILACALCDTHGFLITAKKAAGEIFERQRWAKASLIEFSPALALPHSHFESTQLLTRMGNEMGDGQMIFKVPSRSGQYALGVRYKAVGIGVDTFRWELCIHDEAERLRRHRAILSALRDQMLSPSGAMTATMLPHLTDLQGALVVRNQVGRAPLYSSLEQDFIQQLEQTGQHEKTGQFLPFDSVSQFSEQMQRLIENSYPCTPRQ